MGGGGMMLWGIGSEDSKQHLGGGPCELRIGSFVLFQSLSGQRSSSVGRTDRSNRLTDRTRNVSEPTGKSSRHESAIQQRKQVCCPFQVARCLRNEAIRKVTSRAARVQVTMIMSAAVQAGSVHFHHCGELLRPLTNRHSRHPPPYLYRAHHAHQPASRNPSRR